jgi:hypothetical protein
VGRGVGPRLTPRHSPPLSRAAARRPAAVQQCANLFEHTLPGLRAECGLEVSPSGCLAELPAGRGVSTDVWRRADSDVRNVREAASVEFVPRDPGQSPPHHGIDRGVCPSQPLPKRRVGADLIPAGLNTSTRIRDDPAAHLSGITPRTAPNPPSRPSVGLKLNRMQTSLRSRSRYTIDPPVSQIADSASCRNPPRQVRGFGVGCRRGVT